MKKFTFVVDVYVGMEITVAAEDLEDAVAKAQDAPVAAWTPSGVSDVNFAEEEISEAWVDDEPLSSSHVKAAWRQ